MNKMLGIGLTVWMSLWMCMRFTPEMTEEEVVLGGKVCQGTVLGVECVGIADYNDVVASAATATPGESAGLCRTTLTARMSAIPSQNGAYVREASDSGIHGIIKYQYNDAGKVITGLKTTHEVEIGKEKWNDSITLE